MEAITLLAACIPSMLTGVFLFFFQHRIQKNEKKAVARDNTRIRYMKLIVDMLLATHALSEANTGALQTGKTNGEVERALAYAREIKYKYRDFLEESGIQHIF